MNYVIEEMWYESSSEFKFLIYLWLVKKKYDTMMIADLLSS